MLKKFNWITGVLFLILALLLSFCNKEKTGLGLELQPPGDKLNVTYSDTAKVVAYSQRVDSVKTDETSVSLLGSLTDPVFGNTTASFYTQFRLSETSFDFGTNPVVDSLILTLRYKNYYGDTNSTLTVSVHELSEQLHLDSAYYSQMTAPVKETLLGEKTFVPNFSGDVIVGTDTLAPHLRINIGSLSSELATKLVSLPADSMATNTSFLNNFYGLSVESQTLTSGGVIIYFDLLANLSEMTLYYHNDAGDSLSYVYIINSNCARFGHYTHDYSIASPAFISQVINKDTSLGQNICYNQSLAGVKTFIRFPNIKNYYTNGKVAVNEAKLFIKCNETLPTLHQPSNLVLVLRDSVGGYTITEDQLIGEAFFGGTFDSTSNGYWFRITSTVQEMMRSATKDYGLDLYVSGGAVNAQRVLLDGPAPQLPAPPENRMKLVITYTNLY
jgi:hypothetical protein